MLRYLGELVSLVFFFLLVRSAISGVGQVLRGGGQMPGPRHPGAHDPETMRTSGALHKDPVCGTFVSTSTAYTREADGVVNYFCSAECRDRFRSERRSTDKWPKSSTVRS